jgi:plasmid stabilization system protein ParE
VIVHLSFEAQDQADEIEARLRERSPALAERFRDEIGRALQCLAAAPLCGVRFRRGPYRRLLLTATQHHLYYVADGEVVTGRAVWYAGRGRGPAL